MQKNQLPPTATAEEKPKLAMGLATEGKSLNDKTPSPSPSSITVLRTHMLVTVMAILVLRKKLSLSSQPRHDAYTELARLAKISQLPSAAAAR